MAEASVAVYGVVIGVAIAVAVVTFALRRKSHSEGTHDLGLNKIQCSECGCTENCDHNCCGDRPESK